MSVMTAAAGWVADTMVAVRNNRPHHITVCVMSVMTTSGDSVSHNSGCQECHDSGHKQYLHLMRRDDQCAGMTLCHWCRTGHSCIERVFFGASKTGQDSDEVILLIEMTI